MPPAVADGVPVRWVDPASPWLADVGGDPSSARHRAGLAIRVALLFDDTKADLRHTEEFECVVVGLGERQGFAGESADVTTATHHHGEEKLGAGAVKLTVL